MFLFKLAHPPVRLFVFFHMACKTVRLHRSVQSLPVVLQTDLFESRQGLHGGWIFPKGLLMALTETSLSIRCPHCGMSRMRSCRFHLADLPYLFLLQLPLRCEVCMERSHVSYRAAWRLLDARQARRLRHLAREEEKTPKNDRG